MTVDSEDSVLTEEQISHHFTGADRSIYACEGMDTIIL